MQPQQGEGQEKVLTSWGLTKRNNCPEGNLWLNLKLFSPEKAKSTLFFLSLIQLWLESPAVLSWPHILYAKALVDKIYGVVRRSRLSNVGCNHKRELSGPSRVDLVSVEGWTTSLKTACLSCGCSTPKNEATEVLLL